MNTDRSFGAVVYHYPNAGMERHYLLVHHISGGHWDHPKGHPELGESPKDTARREIGEECGVLIEFEEGFFTEVSWVLPDGRRKVVGFYLAHKTGKEIDRSAFIEKEILQFRWLPYKEAKKLITYDTGRRVLDEAERFISKAY